MASSILIIDDDITLLRNLGEAFGRAGWDVHRELSGEAGLRTCRRVLPDVLLVDLHLPGMDGLEFLDALEDRVAAVIILTGDGHVPTAVRAMSLGAENFLVKPVDLDHLIAAARRAAEKARLRRVNRALVGQCGPPGVLDPLGDAPAMQELKAQLTLLARSDHRGFLIEGEIGTGKASVARMLHDLSARRDEAFMELHGATTDPPGLEATLFGVEAGAGEPASRPGLLEIADQGTMLIREVTALPLPIQARVAEAMDRHAIRRQRGTREIPVDVRLVVTSAVAPPAAVEHGQLEPALYFRVKGGRLALLPLREFAAADLAAAMQRILRAEAPGLPGAPTVLTDDALERLVSHAWPGNFLEARHVIQRALLLARGARAVGAEHLPGEFRNRSGPFDRRHTPLTMEEVERMHIERTLKHHDGNRTRAAQELGISRATLIAKIKRYAIPH
jgi:DNA-binding NtrC family response regulator